MDAHFRYSGQSGLVSTAQGAHLAFATNTLREAAYFSAELKHPTQLREGLGALYSVVTADLKYRPRDRPAFRAWLEEQDRRFLASLGQRSEESRRRLEVAEARLEELRGELRVVRGGYYAARARYLEYAMDDAWEAEYLLDPIVTIHPDELAFEAFSRDGSSYGRLGIRHGAFERIDEFQCGTTNVDFSLGLHRRLELMRSYRSTRFDVAASGLGVRTGGETHREKKIPLPEGWVEGLLQVHSTMTLGLTRLRLAPIDLYNLCRFIARHKAQRSPRAMRFELEPGRPAVAVFEPWEHRIPLSAIYEGPKLQTIRTWGRRRLAQLERLLPLVESVDLYLAGHGMPTIWVCDLGGARFTLALSGWTDNDWTGQSRFALLSRRLEVDADVLGRAYAALRSDRRATGAELASAANLSLEQARSAASALCQVGRAMFDLGSGCYRHRDLFLTPFDAKKALAKAKAAEHSDDPQSKAARAMLDRGDARIIAHRPVSTGYKVSGSAKGADGKRVRPRMHIDHEGRIVEASCTCRHYAKHKMTKGPCEHMLALRLAHMERIE